jgi:hypothetical protein
VDLRIEPLTKDREADFLALMPRDDLFAVEACPLHGTGHETEEVWTGPESLYVAAGFTDVSRGPRRVYRREL